MTMSMSTDPQTQAIARVTAAVAAVGNAPVAGPAPDAEAAASAPDGEIASERSVEHMYQAGLARLEALHDRWAAAMAEIREMQASSEPGTAAA
jgi:hypothetical protein